MTHIFWTSLIGCVTIIAQSPDREVARDIPKPFATKSVIKHPRVIGWPKGQTPKASPGFTVTAVAQPIESPRWIYVLPNGDVLIAQSRTLPPPAKKPTPEEKEKEKGLKKSKTVTGTSPNQITLLRDADADGSFETSETFLSNLNQPFGMLVIDQYFYVANTDGVWKYPYQSGATAITGNGTKIVDLPAGGYNNHWTRNIVTNKTKDKLFISVGSASNVAEHGIDVEHHRACILVSDLDGKNLRVYASGLRNPVGMDWQPHTGELWTAVNERDELGDDLVPDYLTSVKEGGFYGWPYAYWGQREDPRRKGERPDLVKASIKPDLDVGSHTASLGLVFYRHSSFPQKYHNGAFVGQRGSWNRSSFVGYRVAFVPFHDGKPTSGPEDFLTGFIANQDEVYGRPVGVAVASDGALLVADEPGNTVWRVAKR